MYHRVVDVAIDPWRLCVSPKHFAQHVDVLSKEFNTVSLTELADCIDRGSLPKRTVVVTFDDGFACNAHAAEPILANAKLPATVFVTTGMVGRQEEAWWDRLEHALLRPDALPDALELTISGAPLRWQLGRAAASLGVDDQATLRSALAWEAAPGTRLAFFHDVWGRLRPLARADRDEALARIAAWAGAELGVRPEYRLMTLDEVRSLVGGTFTLGAHSVSHPHLPSLTAEQQRMEIAESCDSLRELTDRPVDSFAYPFGEYDSESLRLVAELGLRACCTTNMGTVSRRSRLLELPRVSVPDCDRAQFAALMGSWTRS
jgi:peptidoglycan/xylan/chitin deacetylase (PgdA/CDA1 family)